VWGGRVLTQHREREREREITYRKREWMRMEKERNELEWKERKQQERDARVVSNAFSRSSKVTTIFEFRFSFFWSKKKTDSVSFLKIKNKTIRY
jgi:hypothetical protein